VALTEPLRYEVEITRERLEGATGQLEQTLWLLNDRRRQYYQSRMPYRPLLRKAGIVLSVVAFGLAISGMLLTRGGTFFTIFALAFLVTSGLFAAPGPLERWLRRVARRMASRRARTGIARLSARTPYTVRYELRPGSLAADVEAHRLHLDLDLKTVRLAIAAASLVTVFNRPRPISPTRLLPVPGPAERAALCAALSSAGAEVLELPDT
jgi:hypothetical protein